jgi:hypothetical protein
LGAGGGKECLQAADCREPKSTNCFLEGVAVSAAAGGAVALAHEGVFPLLDALFSSVELALPLGKLEGLAGWRAFSHRSASLSSCCSRRLPGPYQMVGSLAISLAVITEKPNRRRNFSCGCLLALCS